MSGSDDEQCRCGCDDFKAYGYTSYCNNCGHRHTGLVSTKTYFTAQQNEELKDLGKVSFCP